MAADYPSLVANILHYPLRWRTIGNHAATKRLQPLSTTYKAARGLSETSTFGADGKLDFKGGGLRGTFTAIAPSGGIAPAELVSRITEGGTVGCARGDRFWMDADPLPKMV